MLNRVYMGGVERGQRNVGVVNLHRVAEIASREPRRRFWGSANAIGAPKAYIARTRQIRSSDYGFFADGVKVACFAEGRIGYREWARRRGRLGGIQSIGDRYDRDVDELMA